MSKIPLAGLLKDLDPKSPDFKQRCADAVANINKIAAKVKEGLKKKKCFGHFMRILKIYSGIQTT